MFFSLCSGHCNATWDGFLCWPMTAPGEVATQPCPANIKGIIRDSEEIYLFSPQLSAVSR